MEGDGCAVSGDRMRSASERLIDAVEGLNLQQMDSVAESWHRMPRWEREAAWTVVRRSCRATASDEPLDFAFRVRRAANRASRLAGAHDWAFSSAAWDAGLALASAYDLKDRHFLPLVTPMAQALPWLLERAADSEERAPTRLVRPPRRVDYRARSGVSSRPFRVS
jgi:hypothetical protein